MARKRLNAVEAAPKEVTEVVLDNLSDLMESYNQYKEQEKKIKKLLSEQNTNIKGILSANDSLKNEDGDYVYSNGNLVAKLSNRISKSLNEDMLLQVAKKHKLDIIRTKEYVDMDALEDLMYKDQLSKDIKLDILECEQTKVTPTLTIKAIKRK